MYYAVDGDLLSPTAGGRRAGPLLGGHDVVMSVAHG